MSDVSQGEGWWLASDGKWYPPESKFVVPPPPPPPPPPTPFSPSSQADGPVVDSPSRRFIPMGKGLCDWTQGLMWANGGAAVLYALLANNYRGTIIAFREGRGSRSAVVEAENWHNAFGSFFLYLWIAGFVLHVIWISKAHTTTSSLLASPTQRKYSRGWAIGVWFIPFANIFSTPQVFAEHQRIADAPRSGGIAVADWKTTKVRPTLIWWWILMIGGAALNTGGVSLFAAPQADHNDYRDGLLMHTVGLLAIAAGMFFGAVFIRQVSEKLRAAVT